MSPSSTTRYFALRTEFDDSLIGYFDTDPDKTRVAGRQGSIKLIDALLLKEMLQQESPAKILEVGSFVGFSTRWILEAAPAAHVTSLDPGIPHRIFKDTRGHLSHFNSAFVDRLTLHTAFLPPVNYKGMAQHFHERGDIPGSLADVTAHLKTVPTADDPFDTFDFAFVDGDHSYRATWGNVARVAKMLRPGAMLVVHDAVSWTEVVPALKDLEKASKGALELLEVTGDALHKDLRPYFEQSMRPRAAEIACDTFCNGMAVLRVHGPLEVKDDAGVLARFR